MRKIELKTKVVQKSICARLVGDVDSGNALALRDALSRVTKDAPQVVFLDLAGVGKMDSAGIAVLVEAHDTLKSHGKQLGLINTPETVKGLLQLLGVFEMYHDLETGLRETTRVKQRLHDRTKPQQTDDYPKATS
jgi:anti-anti-sigma factor